MDDNMKRKQRIVSLTLAATMLLSGCGHIKFNLIENENNELTASDNSYISSKNLDLYKVVELYNKVTGKNEIYIMMDTYIANDIRIYLDVFTNMKVRVGSEQGIFKFVKETTLSDYAIALDMMQKKYTLMLV